MRTKNTKAWMGILSFSRRIRNKGDNNKTKTLIAISLGYKNEVNSNEKRKEGNNIEENTRIHTINLLSDEIITHCHIKCLNKNAKATRILRESVKPIESKRKP